MTWEERKARYDAESTIFKYMEKLYAQMYECESLLTDETVNHETPIQQRGDNYSLMAYRCREISQMLSHYFTELMILERLLERKGVLQ